jgi:hypothetical protein
MKVKYGPRTGTHVPGRTAMSHRTPRPRRRSVPATPYAGPTICLRCEETFESWDRRQNRLCDACRHTIAQQPSDEPAHSISKPRR